MRNRLTRTKGGDLTLPFFGFILTAAISIAAITGVAQFNIISQKINAALEEGKKASVQYIKENVSDSALIGTISSETQAELDLARVSGVNAANSALGSNVYDMLMERNPGEGSLAIFDNAETFVRAGSNGTVEIQMGVNAKVLANVPVSYARKTSLTAAKPSELSTDNACPNLSCSSDCGDCGACDTCSGKCVPDYQVPNSSGDGYKTPNLITATATNIACYPEDVDGCLAIGEGWEEFEENGYTGCQKDNCRVIPDRTYYFTYTSYGWFGDSGDYSSVYYDGANLSAYEDYTNPEHCQAGDLYTRGDNVSAYYEASGYNGTTYPTYAVCTSEYVPDDERKIFVTSGTYSQLSFNGKTGADSLCQSAASAAGLGGSYMAFMSGGYSQPNLKDLIPKDTALRRIDGQLVNKCPLYEYANDLPINVTQYNTTINGSIVPGACGPYDLFCFPQLAGDEIRVWTGSQNIGTAANHCNYWTSTSGNDIGTNGLCTDTYFWLMGSFPFSGHVCGGPLNGGSNRLYCVESN